MLHVFKIFKMLWTKEIFGVTYFVSSKQIFLVSLVSVFELFEYPQSDFEIQVLP